MLQIDYAKWLKETDLGFTKPRGSQLKALDAAILTYSKASTPENASKIHAALESWERQRGTDVPSARDKTGAVTALKIQLQSSGNTATAYREATFTKEEVEAFKYLVETRKKTLTATFANASVVFVGAKEDTDSAYNKLKSFVQQKKNESKKSKTGNSSGPLPPKEPESKIIATIKEALNKMVEEFFGVAAALISGLSDYLLKLIADVSATVAPFIGHLIDAKDTIIGWGTVGKNAWTKFDISKRHYSIEAGAPKAAFEAVERCLVDEIKQSALKATNSTLTFAAKTGAAFGDGGAATGTAIGIVSALAELARKIYCLAMEWRATKELKKVFANPGTVDVTVFKTYPLAGAYFLVSATLSDVIPISSFGSPGWMDVIEKIKKGDFDKIYDKCEELIQKSPFEIKGLPKRRKVKGSKAEFGKGMADGFLDLAKDALIG